MIMKKLSKDTTQGDLSDVDIFSVIESNDDSNDKMSPVLNKTKKKKNNRRIRWWIKWHCKQDEDKVYIPPYYIAKALIGYGNGK